MFIIVLTTFLHQYSYEHRWIKSTTLHFINLKSILILSIHLRLGLQSGLFPEGKMPTSPHLAEDKQRIVFLEWHRQCNYVILLIFLSLPLPRSRFSPSLPLFNRPRSVSLSYWEGRRISYVKCLNAEAQRYFLCNLIYIFRCTCKANMLPLQFGNFLKINGRCFLRRYFRPWEGRARQDTLSRKPPEAAYLTNGSLFCVFVKKN